MFSRGAQITLGVLSGLLASPFIYMLLCRPNLQGEPWEHNMAVIGGLVCGAVSVVCIVPYGRPYTIRLLAAVAAIWGGYSVVNAAQHIGAARGNVNFRALVYGPALALTAGYYAITGQVPERILKLIVPQYKIQSSRRRANRRPKAQTRNGQ